MRERAFWRTAAWLVVGMLAAMAWANASGALAVPSAALAFAFSCLLCNGVGYSVVSPGSSPARLDSDTERAVRKRQLVAGLAISVGLALLLLVPEARRGPLPWLLAPVIALSPVLIVRHWLGWR